MGTPCCGCIAILSTIENLHTILSLVASLAVHTALLTSCNVTILLLSISMGKEPRSVDYHFRIQAAGGDFRQS